MVNQGIHLLDDAAELLLLGTELILQAIEANHHIIELSVLCLLLVLFTVEHAELVLEFSLDLAL